MYKALDVAKYIIDKCNEKNMAIGNLKLQKVLYFVQAEFLVVKNIPCFIEEIEAWSFGPVIPEVYREYKVYGGAIIPVFKKNDIVFISKGDQELIDGIIDECAKYSTSTLVNIIRHQSPWREAYYRINDNVISKQSIKEYFDYTISLNSQK